jgi:hypothetical protein
MICPDITLIQAVKEKQDSNALLELADKHTGIYINVINKYSYIPEIEKQELVEHKLYNIYNYALTYNPEKGMQFSTWVGQSTKWQCQSLLSKKVESEEISDKIPENIEPLKELTDRDSYEMVLSKVKECEDERFSLLFKLRHGGAKPVTWKKCGKKIGTTAEGARWLYNKFYEQIKKNIIKNENKF